MLNYILKFWNFHQEFWLVKHGTWLKQFILRNLKCDIISDVDKWLSEMCDLSIVEKTIKGCNSMWQRICGMLQKYFEMFMVHLDTYCAKT